MERYILKASELIIRFALPLRMRTYKIALSMIYQSGLKIEDIVIPFSGERETKVSSALTQMRRNARTVAKRMFETFASLSPGKGITISSIFKPDWYMMD